MIFDDEQFERIAKHLDGEKSSLSSEEKQVISDIHHSDVFFAGILDVDVPAQAIAKANRRMQAQLANPYRSIFRRAGLIGAISAAAIILILATLSYVLTNNKLVSTQSRFTEIPLEILVDAMSTSSDQQSIDDLAGEIDIIDSQLLASVNQLQSRDIDDLDVELDTLGQEIDSFWFEDTVDVIPEG